MRDAKSTTSPFRKLLTAVIQQTGQPKGDIAKAIGLTPSALSHLHTRPASVLVCLRIAKYARVHPSRLLRAAGHSETADLIESLYGPAASIAAPSVSVLDANVIAALKQLPAAAAKNFRALIFMAAGMEEMITGFTEHGSKYAHPAFRERLKKHKHPHPVVAASSSVHNKHA